MAPVSRISILLVLGGLACSGCSYAEPYTETREDIRFEYVAGPSTAVYLGLDEVGEYRLQRFEGRGEESSASRRILGLGIPDVRSSREIAQPFSADRLRLQSRDDGRVRMAGEGAPEMDWEFVVGDWPRFVAGEDVVLRLREKSWQTWITASRDAWLLRLDAHRRQVFQRTRDDQEVTNAEITDVLVVERPLLRANRREMFVFFETLRMQGRFAIVTRTRDPSRGWWAETMSPATERILGGIAVAGVYAAAATVQWCARCICR